MKQKLLTLIALFCLWSITGATGANVSGHVYFGPDDIAIPAQGVQVTASASDGIIIETITDEDGYYAFEFDLNQVPGDVMTIVLSTFDFCSGEEISVTVELIDDPTGAGAVVDFNICPYIDPPDPVGCQAFFDYQQTGVDPYIVQFYDISYSETEITEWQWEFGDGTSSAEPQPEHQYEAPGEYLVTLTIVADTCTSSDTYPIYVSEELCDCDWEWEPVCVITAAGEMITFPNLCWAECEGYSADEVVECETDPCDCPEYYDPVCVITPDGVTLTFDNICFAACEGYSPEEVFSCNGDCNCYLIWDPVCVIGENGEMITFSNLCFAECEGFTEEDLVECEEDCICPDYWDPVCVMDPASGEMLTFSNICFAECEGYTEEDLVECSDCNCPLLWDPVCVLGPDGDIWTFPNFCFAECEGFSEEDLVPCNDCNCPDVWDPVCAIGEDGQLITFPNMCWAECEGFGPDQLFECNDCDCPDVWEPVCVVGEDGVLITFPNMCWAECDGFTEEDLVNCGDCVCPDYWDPVCVVGEDGDIITFPNFCWAECDGFTEEDLVPCDDCECPDVWDPVCVQLSPLGPIMQFPNFCMAQCEGFTEEDLVDCGGCECPDVWEPVCVVVNGQIITFPNFCFAECEGFTEEDLVECNDCNCPDVWDPVCVQVSPMGPIIQFPNLCFAECEGYGGDQIVDCEDDCVCPDIYDPVCVITDNGLILTYQNLCWAECEGYGPDQIINCDDDCVCPDIWDPVCIATPGGGFITFPNLCFAECEGFNASDVVDCNNTEGCFAEFYYEHDWTNPFTASFFDISFSVEGEVVSWLWDFGDGDISNGQNPVHTYQEEGIFDVVLTITTESGCTSTTIQHICIGDDGVYNGPDCQAMYFFEVDEEDLQTYYFSDLSMPADEIDSWFWDFGDGTESDEQNPTHTFEEAGWHVVSLTIVAGDCTSSTEMLVFSGDNVWYENECIALFLPLIDTESYEVFFLNLSNPFGGPVMNPLDVSYSWDFGDGNTSEEAFPFHQYESAGTYEVSLTISTEDCENTFTVVVDLEDNDFTGSPVYELISGTEEPAEEYFQGVKAFPNPTNGQISISFDARDAGDFTLELIGLDGRVIQTQEGRIFNGSNKIDLDVSALPSGIYSSRIRTGDHVRSIKIVKAQ